MEKNGSEALPYSVFGSAKKILTLPFLRHQGNYAKCAPTDDICNEEFHHYQYSVTPSILSPKKRTSLPTSEILRSLQSQCQFKNSTPNYWSPFAQQHNHSTSFVDFNSDLNDEGFISPSESARSLKYQTISNTGSVRRSCSNVSYFNSTYTSYGSERMSLETTISNLNRTLSSKRSVQRSQSLELTYQENNLNSSGSCSVPEFVSNNQSQQEVSHPSSQAHFLTDFEELGNVPSQHQYSAVNQAYSNLANDEIHKRSRSVSVAVRRASSSIVDKVRQINATLKRRKTMKMSQSREPRLEFKLDEDDRLSTLPRQFISTTGRRCSFLSRRFWC